MGPEDDYPDLQALLADYSRYPVYSRNPIYSDKGGTAKTPIVSVGVETFDMATSQAMLRKQTIANIRVRFKDELEKANGHCYATEVRSTGVMVCGIHHSLWDGESDSCATMDRELTLLSKSAYEVLSGVKLTNGGGS